MDEAVNLAEELARTKDELSKAAGEAFYARAQLSAIRNGASPELLEYVIRLTDFADDASDEGLDRAVRRTLAEVPGLARQQQTAPAAFPAAEAGMYSESVMQTERLREARERGGLKAVVALKRKGIKG